MEPDLRHNTRQVLHIPSSNLSITPEPYFVVIRVKIYHQTREKKTTHFSNEWDGDVTLVEDLIQFLVFPPCLTLMSRDIYSINELHMVI